MKPQMKPQETQPQTNPRRERIRRSVLAALFAAVTAVMGLIYIPIGPVPITGQTLGVMLAGTILGRRLGAWSQTIFLLLVAIGAPVVAGFRGGLDVLFGPTGGYLLSWPIAAYLIGWGVETAYRRRGELGKTPVFIWNFLGGLVLIHLFGVPFLAYMTQIDLLSALVTGSLPFLPGDLIKALLTTGLALHLYRAYPQAFTGLEAADNEPEN